MIKTLKVNLVYLIKSGKALGIILDKFAKNPAIQVEIIGTIETKLNTIIESIKVIEDFSLLLNNLEQFSPELQKSIIVSYAPNLVPNTFIELLNSLSEKPALQEKVIETLNDKKALRRLCKGVKEEVLQILHNDSVLCDIVRKAARAQATQFFKKLAKLCSVNANVASTPRIEHSHRV